MREWGQDFQLNRLYGFVRARQLEGTFPGDPETGVWPITFMRIGYGWGFIPEEAWPHTRATWPPNPEPPNLDHIAKQYRISRYRRVRTMDECKVVLAYCGPLLASFDITDAWYTAPSGVIPKLSPAETPTASHAVCLVGYDDSTSRFKFINSWGTDWGDDGCGYIPYDSFEEMWRESWFMDNHGFNGPPASNYTKRAWGLQERTRIVFHGREFVGPMDERIAWAFAVQREEGKVEVEELFVKPQFRNKRYGAALMRSMARLAAENHATLELWISHADNDPANLEFVERLLMNSGLRLENSGVGWAPLVARGGGDQCARDLRPRVETFQRPRSPFYGVARPGWVAQTGGT